MITMVARKRGSAGSKMLLRATHETANIAADGPATIAKTATARLFSNRAAPIPYGYRAKPPIATTVLETARSRMGLVALVPVVRDFLPRTIRACHV